VSFLIHPVYECLIKETELKMRTGILFFLSLLLIPVFTSQAEEIKLSLDKLFSLKVTSVSGTAMDLKKSPAAIYVITSEDFEKQGHLTLSDALRAVPGFHVSKIDSSKMAISARGFAGRFANKLLVLIDGRSVYTPLFAGVYWEIQDMVVDDIDRVEVIRGPGATLWGANAVNGVINVVTKGSRETQGGHLKLGTGSMEEGYGHIRYGGQLTDDLFYRLSLKGFSRGETDFVGGRENNDSWESYQFNLRTDWYATDRDTITFIANTNHTLTGAITNQYVPVKVASFFPTFPAGPAAGFPTPVFDAFRAQEFSGDTLWNNRNFQVEWNRALNSTDGFTIKAYYDLTSSAAKNYTGGVDELRETYDFDARHWFDWSENNSFIWGVSYRQTADEIHNAVMTQFLPNEKRLNTYSMFLQNTYRFDPKWALMVGTKFEYNDQTDFEVQPSLRLTYDFSDDTTFWASFSRAVRKPARSDDELILGLPGVGGFSVDDLLASQGLSALYPSDPANIYLPVTIVGNTDTDSEELLAWEMGMRQDYLDKRLTLDLAVFFNDYSHLGGFNNVDSNPLTLESTDDDHGESYGVEASIKYKATDKLDIMFNYTWFKLLLHGVDEGAENGSASSIIYTALNYKIAKNLSWYTTIFYSDNRKNNNVHEYVTLDTGLSWQVNEKLKLSAWGKNLTDPHQVQSGGDGVFQNNAAGIPRSFFVEMSYKF